MYLLCVLETDQNALDMAVNMYFFMMEGGKQHS